MFQVQAELLPDYRVKFGGGLRERRGEAPSAWTSGEVFAFDTIRSTLPALPANTDDVLVCTKPSPPP